MMVSSAVLGAAAGTGLALFIAVTIVVYRYYSSQRKIMSWSSLDRWPEPAPSLIVKNQPKILRQQLNNDGCGSSGFGGINSSRSGALPTTSNDLEACHVLGPSRKSHTCYYALRNTPDLNVAREQHATQPSANESGSVQSRPCSRMGLGVGRALSSLSRRASSGSQEQLPPMTPDHQQQQQQSPHHLHHHPHHQHLLQLHHQQQQQQQQSLQHAASLSSCTPSPQIRAYGPDGSHHNHETLHAAASYPPCRGSRSPSPVRAASLDTRCAPLPTMGQVSSSLSSLASSHAGSISGGSGGFGYAASSSSGSNSSPKPPNTPGPGRCLSPLLIPPRASFSLGDSGSLPPASPLGALQPDLYQRRDGPLFLSNARRSGKSIGQLHIRLSYDFDKSDLNVHLIEAQELAGGEQGGFSDPYVKLTLSPEVDTRKRQTPYHHNDSNPVFDQHFKFPVSHEELQDKTLLLQVLDFDRFSRNDVVGSVRIALEELDITSTSPLEVWSDISRERKPPEETQEVFISLSYLPSAERLTLTVLKARNLFTAPGKDSLDPFVKVGLLCGEKRVKKKKTATRKATRCPVWNEAMTFNVPASSLQSSAIEICVLDASSEQSGNNAIVGSCIVGPGMAAAANIESSSMSNTSREHWLQMTHSPRETIAMWHTLH